MLNIIYTLLYIVYSELQANAMLQVLCTHLRFEAALPLSLKTSKDLE